MPKLRRDDAGRISVLHRLRQAAECRRSNAAGTACSAAPTGGSDRKAGAGEARLPAASGSGSARNAAVCIGAACAACRAYAAGPGTHVLRLVAAARRARTNALSQLCATHAATRFEDNRNAAQLAPVGIGAWIGVFVLLAIPLVNVIMTIIWACCAMRRSLRNFARALIVCWLVLLILAVVAGVLLARAHVSLPELLMFWISSVLPQ